MNNQDRNIIQELIEQAKTEPQIIKLDDYPVIMFRNIYNEATIAGLKITVIERGKSFRIERNDKINH